MNEINLLILSCGTRNKVVEYFKKELQGKGKVFTTDCSTFAPALYEADEYFIVPKINDPAYKETILDICKKNNITALFSLIDSELDFLSNNYKEFMDIKSVPIISNHSAITRSLKKYEMYEFLTRNGYPTIKTFNELMSFSEAHREGLIDFPVFVKPEEGSASLNINLVYDYESLKNLFNNHKGLIIQEYIKGQEYGIDVYVDLITNEPTSIFVKEKLKMRAGETDKSVSFKDEKLFSLVRSFVIDSGYSGMIDIDVFKVGEQYLISEVNPRFGGGYPHAYECGVNFPKLLLDNIQGNITENQIGNYEENIYMLKYSETKILRNINSNVEV